VDRAGDVADLLAAYDHWHPQVRAILQAFDETFRWAIFERSPMPRWSRGRVTLLGDACHAMLPCLAQGAAQAMEDGVTLAAPKAHRTRDLASYSLGNLLLANVGNAVHSVYVFSLPVGPIWALHSFYLTTSGLMLIWWLRYRRRFPRSTKTTPEGGSRVRQRRPQQAGIAGPALGSGRTGDAVRSVSESDRRSRNGSAS
jgi:hypothetical protein